MSCVVINDGLEFLHQYRHTTPLKSLVLEECEVSASGLSSVLCAPKALTHLELGENIKHLTAAVSAPYGPRQSVPNETRKVSYRQNLGNDLEALLAALSQQAHSLQHFTHLSRSPRPLQGLNQFSELRRIELATGMDVLELSKDERLLPPNLQELVMVEPEYSWGQRIDHITSLLAMYWATHLKSVAFVIVFRSTTNLAKTLWESSRAEKVHKAAYQLRARGIQLRILVRVDSTGAIPPYLYGERVPVPVLVYNSHDYSFEAKSGIDVSFMQVRKKDELSPEDINALKTTTDRLVNPGRPAQAQPRFGLLHTVAPPSGNELDNFDLDNFDFDSFLHQEPSFMDADG